MKKAILNQFTKQLVNTKPRKNSPTTQDITSTLMKTALDAAFVNESCKSSGNISKSQVIYRKLDGNTLELVQSCFQKNTLRFLRLLRIFSRNRKFIISFDTTKEAFYGDFPKAEDKLYLHHGSIVKGSTYYYEYLTTAITCNGAARYILDGIIVPRGAYIEDYIAHMLHFVKEHLPLDIALFDRGFTSWAVIAVLKELHVPYLIFWRKYGDWYEEHFDRLDEGGWMRLSRRGRYNRHKTNYPLTSDFILVKQHEYKGKKYDWIFATNCSFKTAESYIKRYKKRWGIETIYRVTDKIRAYTTSTRALIRYFLFMFTCLVYNVWKFFQTFLGDEFTLANFKTNMTIFMAKTGMIYPSHYDQFEGMLSSHVLLD